MMNAPKTKVQLERAARLETLRADAATLKASIESRDYHGDNALRNMNLVGLCSAENAVRRAEASLARSFEKRTTPTHAARLLEVLLRAETFEVGYYSHGRTGKTPYPSIPRATRAEALARVKRNTAELEVYVRPLDGTGSRMAVGFPRGCKSLLAVELP